MGNLRRTPTYVLVNSWDADYVPLTFITGGVFVADYGNIMAANVVDYWKCCYCPGIPGQVLIHVLPLYPCDDCKDATPGFVVFKTHVMTGAPLGTAGRPDNFYGLGKAYYSVISNPSASTETGYEKYLSEQDSEKAAADIVNQIGYSVSNNEAIVYAYQRVLLDYTSGVITLKVYDVATGALYHTFTGATIALLAANIGTSHKIHVIASAVNQIEIEGQAGFGFYLTLTNISRNPEGNSIRLKQKDLTKPFIVKSIEDIGSQEVLDVFQPTKVDPKDVARRFPITPLSFVGTQRELPIKNGEYCVYYFRIKHTDKVYDLVGANHLNTYYEEVYFYVYSTAVATLDAILASASLLQSSSCDCPSDSYVNSTSYDSSASVIR